jgi:Cu(I)/Ag(I) efflux system membrane fusion protein
MKWLVIGLVAGLAIAAGIYAVRPQATLELLPVTTAADKVEHDVSHASESPSGVAFTEDEEKAAGVEITEAKRGTVRKGIVASGKVSAPETGLGTISARISGRIEKLYLNVTGEGVSRGQPVALIFSPEILAAAEEYKLANENRQRLQASKESQAIEEADALVRASRRRLELRGLTPEQIDGMLSEASSTQVTTYSPLSGVVTERNVAEGQYVKEGDVLYTVTDLSTVWVEADIFEADIPFVRSGQSTRITAPALGNTALRGSVNFLQPGVDPQTRTMKARVQIANPELRLRPGMFVQVSMEASVATDAVTVPRSAVLDTGNEKIVYVAKGNGVFEKRSIEISFIDDEFVAVARGLNSGEQIVTHGSFLIDSQSRLSGAMTGMFGGSKAFDEQTAVTLRFEPASPKGGADATFHVSVNGPDSKPITDAAVQLTLVMPAMPAMGMSEMRASFDLRWNGTEYVGTGRVPMPGAWNVTVEARRNGQVLGVYRSRFDAR